MFLTPISAHGAGLLDHRVDLRLSRRYPIELELEYKLLRQGQRFGFGKTLNISSGGVLLQLEHALPDSRQIEIRVNWPLLLDGVYPLRLVIQGYIVRRDSKVVAVQIKRYEFVRLAFK